jgi:hypothetical protein
MTTIEQAESAIKDNLYLIFGEENVAKRKEAIERIWASSNESVLAAPEGIFHGHDNILKSVDAVITKFAGWTFKDKGELRLLLTLKVKGC